MAYETVTVRMNRSEPGIKWGVGFRRQGNDLVIGNVDRDSLSEKAGIKIGDIVKDILGRTASNMDGSEATRICDSSPYEVTLSLQRFVTSHACLPWTLTEKDNKIVVDEVKPFGASGGAIGAGFGTNFGSNFGTNFGTTNRGFGTNSMANNFYNTNNFSSQKQNYHQTSTTNFSSYGSNALPQNHYPAPLRENRNTANQFNSYNNTSNTAMNQNQSWTRNDYSKSNEHRNPVTIPTTFLGNKQETFAPSASRLPFARKANQNYFDNSYINNINSSANNWQQNTGGYNTSSYLQGSMPSNGGGTLQKSATDQDINRFGSSGQNYNNYPTNYRSSSNVPPQSYSYNNGVTSSPYGRGSGGIPLNEQTYIQTSGPDVERYGRATSRNRTLSPSSRVFYHSPSPRSRNELSPGASIRHLQYNSPMNLYSVDAAAEEYYQQTGRMPSVPLHDSSAPAYMNSATRKLIEEEERGKRAHSPATQSSSFKRISNAVGTPVQ